MVVAVHQQDIGGRVEGGDCLQRARDAGRERIALGRQIDPLRVGIAHVGGENLAAVRRFPVEGDAVDRQRHPSPDGGVAEAELVVDLRHLGGVAERVR